MLAMAPLSAHADWFSEETPPADAKPLSEIIKSLEDQGYKGIEEMEYDDDAWVIDVHQAGDKEVELHVDPVSGQIVKTK
ncbi:MAG: PepSY domain-containing protein [Dongiaceae bacterium]